MSDVWLLATLGGALIGLSATIHLIFNGRVTGVSGIFFGMLRPEKGGFLWRLMFIGGLILGGLLAAQFLDQPFINETDRSLLVVILAGLLVGFGTKLGSGCTSGHGVCGISRMSMRSLVATGVFILAGIVTVRAFSLLLGGV